MALIVQKIIVFLALLSSAVAAQAEAMPPLPDGFVVVPARQYGSGQTYARIVDKAPIILMIQGSGCDSVWHDTGQGLAPVAAQNLPAVFAPGRTVMVVDKPGVAPGESKQCGADFTLNAWVQHLAAAIAAVRDVGGSDGPVALIGISEGAVTAAHLAAVRDDVGHVVFVSAAGCLLIDDMIAKAPRAASGSDDQDGLKTSDRIEQASAAAEAELRRIFDPATRPDDRVWGHPAAYWRSFGIACPAQDLAGSNADLFLAYGTADEQVIAEGIEEITARRIIAGRPVTVRRVGEGNHMLTRPGEANPFANLVAVLREAVMWLDKSHDLDDLTPQVVDY